MAAWLTAHSFAYLRIAESVTVSGARLATGRAGSPLAGRVSHPLDDKQGFMKSSHTPILLDQPCLVALDVNPVILPVHTQRGLIDVHGRRGQQAFDGVAFPLGE